MKNAFESEINKLVKYINNIGYFSTKLHPNRNHVGKYIAGEPFDYIILLPDYKACFDAKQMSGDRWNFEDKDIMQADNLKKCKNTGIDAFFLVYFIKKKRMVKFDVDVFIETLGAGRKSLKFIDGEEWKINEKLKKYEGPCRGCAAPCRKDYVCEKVNKRLEELK